MNQYRNRISSGFGNMDMDAFATQNKKIAQAQINQASAGSALEDYTQKIQMPLLPIAGGASAVQKIKATGQKIQEKYQKIKQGIQDTRDNISAATSSDKPPSAPPKTAPPQGNQVADDKSVLPDFSSKPIQGGPPTSAPPPPPKTRPPSNGNAASQGQLQPDNPQPRPPDSAGTYKITAQGPATDVGDAGKATMNDPFQAPRSLMNQKMSVQTLSGGEAKAQNTLGQMRNRIGGNPMVQNAHAAINTAGDDAMDAAGKVASGASKAAEGVYSAVGVAGDVMDALGPIGDLIGLGLGIFGGVEAHKEQEQKQQATKQAQEVASQPTLKTSGAAVTTTLDSKNAGQSANIHY